LRAVVVHDVVDAPRTACVRDHPALAQTQLALFTVIAGPHEGSGGGLRNPLSLTQVPWRISKPDSYSEDDGMERKRQCKIKDVESSDRYGSKIAVQR
jgi:hypothetical protein